jgi:hypothetical protein
VRVCVCESVCVSVSVVACEEEEERVKTVPGELESQLTNNATTNLMSSLCPKTFYGRN